MGPLGPVRAAGALFVAGLLAPPLPVLVAGLLPLPLPLLVAGLLSVALPVLDEAFTATAGELSAWLVT
jgi:hypothetical protein